MKLKNKFLTMAEIMTIANNMKNFDTFMEREMCKVIMTVNYCYVDSGVTTDEDGNIDLSLDLYDKIIAELGYTFQLNVEIENYYYIDEQYDSLMDVKTTVNSLLKNIEDKIKTTDFDKFNTANMLDNIKAVVAKIGNK